MGQLRQQFDFTPTLTVPLAQTLICAPRGAPQRPAIDAFVQAHFARAFSAKVGCHYPLMTAIADEHGAIVAAAGVRFADEESLFLERYLDAPVEQSLSRLYGRPVRRETIVEIGSLSASSPQPALSLFLKLAETLLPSRGRTIAVATATPRVEALLRRSQFAVQRLAAADPARVGEEIRDWGAYYAANPQVLAGEIAVPAHLPERLETTTCLCEGRR